MAKRLVLHLGVMKSGTTFIQGRLGANADILDEQGFVFPGTYARQTRAVTDLSSAEDRGDWSEFVQKLRGADTTPIVSMEFLAPLGPRRIRRLKADLDHADIQAVFTLRDLGRTVPAMWQESTQNRQSWPWGDYLEAVRTGSGDAGKAFWRQQNAGKLVQTWVDVLGADKVTVVTVPPAGADRELLWSRFSEAVGLSAADWLPAARSNESLGLVSATVLAALNERVADVDRRTYNRRVKRLLGKSVLAGRRKAEPTIGFTVPDWLREAAEEHHAAILRSGARVLGDLAELEPRDVAGADPRDVRAEDQLEAALDALEALIRQPQTNAGR